MTAKIIPSGNFNDLASEGGGLGRKEDPGVT